ncbi:hypothetical protein Tco_1041151 [Tanacetum coccineum]|uniref:Uncharacterized protein n=1 Tax=Tanacetum coccineum TaxID=301880 RepID=A0ABQ5GGT7_9ASTR
MTASEKYPGDRKFFEIHQNYAEVFNNLIEFGYYKSSSGDDDNDRTNHEDDDGTNGDDDDSDGGNGDDVGNSDDVGNGDNDEDGGNGNDGGNGDVVNSDNDYNDEDGGNGDDVGLVFSKHFDKPPSGSGELSKKNKAVQITVNSVEGDKDLSCSNPSFGFSKITLDDFGNGSSKSPNNPVAEKELVDPIQEGTVVEGNPAEECEIMSTPESYTQWLETNANLVGEIVDAITDEYLYGDLFGDNTVRKEVSNQGPPTPDRLPNRASHASVSLGKRIFESHVIQFESHVIQKENHMRFKTESHVIQTHSGKFSVFGIRLNLETLAPGLWIDANVIDCWGAILNYEERFRDAESKRRHFSPIGCIKKMFARHLKLYGHNRHAKDYGLVGESGLQLDMLRRLRFKFATKMLLHEINVHAQNILDLAKEFNKLDSYVKMSIIVDALKNRKERDCI